MNLDNKNFSEDSKVDFYNRYFDTADHTVYRYDVGSFATRHLIIKQIRHTSGNLLELGTGCSTLLEDLPAFNKFGIDVSERTITQIKNHFEQKKIHATFMVADAESLPFESNFFDVIVTSHTFEHIKNDAQALAECARVLKPGGELIIFVPGRVDGIATEKEFLQLGHYRMYNRARFSDLEASTAGLLQLQSICFPHKVHNLIWNRLKHAVRWANYPIKKWIMRDNKTYEDRPVYQKLILPAVATTLDLLDACVIKKEKNLLGAEFNVLARFEKQS